MSPPPFPFTLEAIAANSLEDTEARLEGLKSKYTAIGLELHLWPNDLRSTAQKDSTTLSDYRLPSARLVTLCKSIVIHLAGGQRYRAKSEDGEIGLLPAESDATGSPLRVVK